MKRVIIFILIISLVLFGSTTFEITFGDIGNDGGYDVIQTSDGGYLLTGWIENFENDSNGVNEAIIIKTDSFGSELWRHVYRDTEGYLSDVQGKRVRESVNSEYFLLTSNAETPFIRFDESGNELNIHTSTGGSDFDFTYDGGFIFVTRTTNENTFEPDMALIKADSLLNREWYSYMNITGRSVSTNKIICTSDSNYVFTASQTYEGSGEYANAMLVKADMTGAKSWSKLFYWGSSGLNWGESIDETTDNQYIFSATSYLTGTTSLFNYTSDGNQVWSNEFEGFGGYSLDITSDLGYVLPASNSIIKTDILGVQEWNSPYHNCIFYAIRQTADGGYIATGTRENPKGDKDIVLIKTREDGLTSINDEQLSIQNYELHQNYPNPFNPYTKIWYTLKEAGNINLSVFNSKGELVQVLSDGIQPKGRHDVKFNASELNSGIYFYKLTTENGCQTRKMLLLK